ncbi:MAG TPA: sigma-70 family RNA polymerase sigma factor [Candidatus Limnocylindrales bacterium]|jgi:RNA polymerase sigma-70 factor (ECF subfamily)|nr:sigma-70 family RNA polymerase sigma factor [Candidatus Limnocylindrales bacterium]
MADGPDLDSLAARACRGDAEAFAALHDALAPRLYRYVRMRVRDPDDTADLVQQVFLKMVEALPRYQPRGVPFAAWAFRLTRNAVIDRARTVHPSHQLEYASGASSTDPGPEEQALLASEVERIRRAIEDLTPEQQEVVRLRFFGGLEPREVGAVLGRRAGAVRALQFRALEALRRTLAAEERP